MNIQLYRKPLSSRAQSNISANMPSWMAESCFLIKVDHRLTETTREKY